MTMNNLMHAGPDLAFPPIVAPIDDDLEFGLPHERAARIAARRIFVAMKRVYLDAASPLPGSEGARLRRRIRNAVEPADLLAVHTELLDALAPLEDDAVTQRHALHRQLGEAFVDAALTGFVPL